MRGAPICQTGHQRYSDKRYKPNNSVTYVGRRFAGNPFVVLPVLVRDSVAGWLTGWDTAESWWALEYLCCMLIGQLETEPKQFVQTLLPGDKAPSGYNQ